MMDETEVLGQPSEGGAGEPAGDVGFEADDSWSTEAAAEDGAAGGGEDPVYDIDGKQYKASELREYMKRGMLEKDYRAKTARLSEERRQITELRQAAEAWQTLQAYPELMQHLGGKIAEMLQGSAPSQPAGAAPEAPPQAEEFVPGQEGSPQPWKTEVEQLQKRMSQVLGTYDQRLNEYNKYLWAQYLSQREGYARNQLTTLKGKYPDLVENEVVAAFRDNKDADLETLAKLSHEHWSEFIAQRQKANLEKRKQNATARVEGAAAKGGVGASPSKSPKTWEDASESALKRLKNIPALFGR